MAQLLAAGAPVNAAVVNRATGRLADLTTPLDLAIQGKSRACIALLEKAGALRGVQLQAAPQAQPAR